jgi:hypothetical protein
MHRPVYFLSDYVQMIHMVRGNDVTAHGERAFEAGLAIVRGARCAAERALTVGAVDEAVRPSCIQRGGVRWRTAERRAERGLQGGAPHGAHLRGNLHEREPELELAGAVGAVLARVLWDMDLVMDGRTDGRT